MSNLWDDQCSSRWFLNLSRVGESTTWAGREFQLLITWMLQWFLPALVTALGLATFMGWPLVPVEGAVWITWMFQWFLPALVTALGLATFMGWPLPSCTCRGSSLEEIIFVQVHETMHKHIYGHYDISSASPVEHGRES